MNFGTRLLIIFVSIGCLLALVQETCTVIATMTPSISLTPTTNLNDGQIQVKNNEYNQEEAPTTTHIVHAHSREWFSFSSSLPAPAHDEDDAADATDVNCCAKRSSPDVVGITKKKVNPSSTDNDDVNSIDVATDTSVPLTDAAPSKVHQQSSAAPLSLRQQQQQPLLSQEEEQPGSNGVTPKQADSEHQTPICSGELSSLTHHKNNNDGNNIITNNANDSISNVNDGKSSTTHRIMATTQHDESEYATTDTAAVHVSLPPQPSASSPPHEINTWSIWHSVLSYWFQLHHETVNNNGTDNANGTSPSFSALLSADEQQQQQQHFDAGSAQQLLLVQTLPNGSSSVQAPADDDLYPERWPNLLWYIELDLRLLLCMGVFCYIWHMCLPWKAMSFLGLFDVVLEIHLFVYIIASGVALAYDVRALLHDKL